MEMDISRDEVGGEGKEEKEGRDQLTEPGG
jgi:hypothetical protein